jgi:hypothetical protein
VYLGDDGGVGALRVEDGLDAVEQAHERAIAPRSACRA